MRSFIRGQLIRAMGRPRYVALREAYYRYNDVRLSYAWKRPDVDILDDDRWLPNARRVEQYRNKHVGQRCFIIGNGPSLQKMDLTLLRNETCFGLNRFYLMFERLGFMPTYCVVMNKLVIEQCSTDLARLRMPMFVNWRARDLIDEREGVLFLRDPYDGSVGFSTDIARGVYEGATVTYVAMQIAFFMGFQQVILIGVDHSFVTQGPPHQVVVSEGDDPNHFDSSYFGKGFKWQLPDLETSELAYRHARFVYGEHGRQIVDATVGGKLQVFPRVDFAALFQRKR